MRLSEPSPSRASTVGDERHARRHRSFRVHRQVHRTTSSGRRTRSAHSDWPSRPAGPVRRSRRRVVPRFRQRAGAPTRAGRRRHSVQHLLDTIRQGRAHAPTGRAEHPGVDSGRCGGRRPPDRPRQHHERDQGFAAAVLSGQSRDRGRHPAIRNVLCNTQADFDIRD